MTDPLEIIAKAKYEAWRARTGSELPWEECHELTRAELKNDQRLALLALAEAELPEEVSKTGRETLLAYGNGSDDMFRAMLRSIANGKTE